MSRFIFSIIFLSLISISTFLQGQVLTGIRGGVTWQYIHQEYNTVNCDPSPEFGIEVKGRKPKLFHLGGSVEYYSTKFSLNYSYGPLGQPGHMVMDYDVSWLRFAVFPEFTVGRRLQFYFNISPYAGVRLNASKSGTNTVYDQGEEIVSYESGSATDDITKVDIGFSESAGLSFSIIPRLVVSAEEMGSWGISNLDKTAETRYTRRSVSLLLCISYVFPGKK